MRGLRRFYASLTFCASFFILLLIFKLYVPETKSRVTNVLDVDIKDFSEANNETGYPYAIVPNIVHLVHFGKPELRFAELISIKSAYQNHKPDRIMIHSNCTTGMSGEYWDMVKDIPVIEVVFKKQPETVFGKNLTWIQHASDVARLQILLEYGGIYLDSDVYVVKSLDRYRKYEFAIAWDYGQYIGSQILIAHKNARFLKLYYESFRDYRGDVWYYNAGVHPTESILYENPHLVHRVPVIFGVDMNMLNMLYLENSNEWRNFDTIHLFLRLVPPGGKDFGEFDTSNIKTYNRTFGRMVRELLFGTTELIYR